MALTPYPPYLDLPLPDKFGWGMTHGWRGAQNSTWVHTMVGWLWTTDTYFRDPAIGAATDWGIGGAGDGEHDGTIIRWIDYKTRPCIPWASGYDVAPDLDGDGSAYVTEFGWVYNAKGQSIETSGLVGTPVSAKQWRSLIWLLAAIHHRELGQDADHFAWNMHHREIAEKDCPWPRVYNYTTEYQNAVKLVMQHYETGADVPASVTIAGLTVALPLAEGGGPVVGPPETPIFVPFGSPLNFTVGPGGATARRWANTASEIKWHYAKGTVIRCRGYYHGESVDGQDRWLVKTGENPWRIHESGFVEPIPEPGVP